MSTKHTPVYQIGYDMSATPSTSHWSAMDRQTGRILVESDGKDGVILHEPWASADLRGYDESITMARAAIEKATGEK